MGNQQQSLFDDDPVPWELDSQEDRLIATVVFSEPPHGPFDYLIPEALAELQPGGRVRVPLGRGNRTVTAYCIDIQNRASTNRQLKEIRSIVDSQPLLSTSMIELRSGSALRRSPISGGSAARSAPMSSVVSR